MYNIYMLITLFFNIGHGEAGAVYEDTYEPRHVKILDTSNGDTQNIEKIINTLLKERIQSIDIDISHSDDDHVGGAYSLWKACEENGIEVKKNTFANKNVNTKLSKLREAVYKQSFEEKINELEKDNKTSKLVEKYFSEEGKELSQEEISHIRKLCGKDPEETLGLHYKYILKAVYSETSLEEAYKQYEEECSTKKYKQKLKREDFYSETIDLVDRNFSTNQRQEIERFFNFVQPETCCYKNEKEEYGYKVTHIFIDLNLLKEEKPEIYEKYLQKCKELKIKPDDNNNQCLMTVISNENGSTTTYGDFLSPAFDVFRELIKERTLTQKDFGGFVIFVPHHGHDRGTNSPDDVIFMNIGVGCFSYDTNNKFNSLARIKRTKALIKAQGGIPLDVFKLGTVRIAEDKDFVYLKIEKITKGIEKVLQQENNKICEKINDENLRNKLEVSFSKGKYDTYLKTIEENNFLENEELDFLKTYISILDKGLFSLKENNRVENHAVHEIIEKLENIKAKDITKEFLVKMKDKFKECTKEYQFEVNEIKTYNEKLKNENEKIKELNEVEYKNEQEQIFKERQL